MADLFTSVREGRDKTTSKLRDSAIPTTRAQFNEVEISTSLHEDILPTYSIGND